MNPLTEVWSDFQSVFPATLKAIADQLSFLGDHRWAAAIVALTIAVRTVLLPLAVKQIRSMQAMQKLQPEMKRLQQKYRNDRQKLNEEMMALYQREGASPFGSCLPMFAQFPVLYAMFFAIRDVPKLYEVAQMPFLGLGNLVDNASSSAAGWLLLAIMTGTQLLSTRQMAKSSPNQNKMMQFLPLFFVVIMINFPAGLVLYWTTQNVYQLIQQTIMLRGSEPPQVKGSKAKGKQPKQSGGGARGAKARTDKKRKR